MTTVGQRQSLHKHTQTQTCTQNKGREDLFCTNFSQSVLFDWETSLSANKGNLYEDRNTRNVLNL